MAYEDGVTTFLAGATQAAHQAAFGGGAAGAGGATGMLGGDTSKRSRRALLRAAVSGGAGNEAFLAKLFPDLADTESRINAAGRLDETSFGRLWSEMTQDADRRQSAEDSYALLEPVAVRLEIPLDPSRAGDATYVNGLSGMLEAAKMGKAENMEQAQIISSQFSDLQRMLPAITDWATQGPAIAQRAVQLAAEASGMFAGTFNVSRDGILNEITSSTRTERIRLWQSAIERGENSIPWGQGSTALAEEDTQILGEAGVINAVVGYADGLDKLRSVVSSSHLDDVLGPGTAVVVRDLIALGGDTDLDQYLLTPEGSAFIDDAAEANRRAPEVLRRAGITNRGDELALEGESLAHSAGIPFDREEDLRIDGENNVSFSDSFKRRLIGTTDPKTIGISRREHRNLRGRVGDLHKRGFISSEEASNRLAQIDKTLLQGLYLNRRTDSTDKAEADWQRFFSSEENPFDAMSPFEGGQWYGISAALEAELAGRKDISSADRRLIRELEGLDPEQRTLLAETIIPGERKPLQVQGPLGQLTALPLTSYIFSKLPTDERTLRGAFDLAEGILGEEDYQIWLRGGTRDLRQEVARDIFWLPTTSDLAALDSGLASAERALALPEGMDLSTMGQLGEKYVQAQLTVSLMQNKADALRAYREQAVGVGHLFNDFGYALTSPDKKVTPSIALAGRIQVGDPLLGSTEAAAQGSEIYDLRIADIDTDLPGSYADMTRIFFDLAKSNSVKLIEFAAEADSKVELQTRQLFAQNIEHITEQIDTWAESIDDRRKDPDFALLVEQVLGVRLPKTIPNGPSMDDASSDDIATYIMMSLLKDAKLSQVVD